MPIDPSLDGVLRWHNHQATTPQIPFAGRATAAMLPMMAVPAKQNDDEEEDEDDNDKDGDQEQEQEKGE